MEAVEKIIEVIKIIIMILGILIMLITWLYVEAMIKIETMRREKDDDSIDSDL